MGLHLYKGADGLRGFACLIVLGMHSVVGFIGNSSGMLSGSGKLGVWLFFVLSAFLLTEKLRREGLHTKSLLEYVIGRAFRIMPPFAVVLILYWVLGTAGINSLHDVYAGITLQQGFAHLWTIPAELKFYCLLPFLIISMSAINLYFGRVGLSIASVIAIGIHQYFWPYSLSPSNSIDMVWYLPAFLVGVYASYAREYAVTERLVDYQLLVVLLGNVALIVLTMALPNHLFGAAKDRWIFIPACFIWGLTLLSVIDGRGHLGVIFSGRFLSMIGRMSYSIYLVHWYFVISIQDDLGKGFIWLSAAVLASIFGGSVFYFVIERPISRLRRTLDVRVFGKSLVRIV